MRDYYLVLKLDSFTSDQEKIYVSYKELLDSYTQNKDADPHFKERISLLNEAYLVLSDSSIKERYDNSLKNNTPDPVLKAMLKEKKEASERFIKAKGIATKKPMSIWTIIFIILMVLMCIVAPLGSWLASERKEERSNYPSYHYKSSYYEDINPSSKYFNFEIPFDWPRITFSRAFQLSIPPTMEFKGASSSQPLNGFIDYNKDIGIFQQRGLNMGMPRAQRLYARIMSFWYPELTDFSTSYELNIDKDVEDLMMEIINKQVSEYSHLLETPTIRNIEIGSAHGIEGKYRRRGVNGSGSVCGTVFFMHSRMGSVVLVLAYRESERGIWGDDMERVVKSFEWV